MKRLPRDSPGGTGRCRAPSLPHFLLRFTLGEHGADVAADLDEEYTVSRLPQTGRIRATAWYWRQALASAGPVLSVKLRHHRRRLQQRPSPVRINMLNGIMQDIRYGIRTLLRRPGFTIVAVLTLAVGIGTNTAIFSVLDSYLFKPLPFRDGSTLVHIFGTDANEEGFGWDMARISAPDYLEMAGGISGFEAVGAYTYTTVNITGGSEPIGTTLGLVTPNMFNLLGVNPTMGRGFTEADGEPGAGKVAILSHRLWRAGFGSDEGIVGRQISLDDESHTVIGVMPEGFDFPFGGVRLWRPAQLSAAAERRSRPYFAVARLADGSALASAQVELDQLAARLESEYAENELIGFRATGLREGLTFFFEYLRLTLVVLAAAVGSILLIACVNVANMMLARGTSRTAEIALRTAIGAGRGRIVRQLLTENLILALLAGALGVGLAAAIVNPVAGTLPDDIWKAGAVAVDRTALFYAIVVTLGTTMLFGLLPALRSSRTDLSASLKEGSRAGGRSLKNSRLSNVLITQQLALSLMLLLGAASLLKMVTEIRSVDLGFEPHGLVTASLSLPSARYSGDQIPNFYREAIENTASGPGIAMAAAISPLPFNFETYGMRFAIDGVTDEPHNANLFNVSPGYFATMQQRVLSGREFEYGDNGDAPRVVIVNDVFAERHWPGQSPVGRTIRIDPADENEPATVIGVVQSGKLGITAAGTDLQVFVPLLQQMRRSFHVIARVDRDEASFIEAVRERIWQIDPSLPVAMRTMDRVLASSLGPLQGVAGVMAILALIALFLAATGIYGVMSHTVNQRLHEFGVRTALGASRRQVTAMVLKGAGRTVAIGLALGLLLALAATKALGAVLPDAPATDLWLYFAVPALLAGIALLASAVPAARATRVDPVEVLRAQ